MPIYFFPKYLHIYIGRQKHVLLILTELCWIDFKVQSGRWSLWRSLSCARIINSYTYSIDIIYLLKWLCWFLCIRKSHRKGKFTILILVETSVQCVRTSIHICMVIWLSLLCVNTSNCHKSLNTSLIWPYRTLLCILYVHCVGSW